MTLAGLGLGGYAVKAKLFTPDTSGGGPVMASTRTAPAIQGGLERTIRLTGATTADRFVSINVPQLRGGRGSGQMMMQIAGMGGGGAVQIRVQGGGGGGGGSSSSSSSTTSTSSSSDTSSSASSSSSSSSSSGFRDANANRFGTTSSTSSAASTTRGATAAALSAGTSVGSGDFQGMSGGANDFMQVLQKVVNNGSIVKKGDPIAEFDRQYQLQRLDDYKASVEQSERSMRRMDADLEVGQKAREQALTQAVAYVEKAKLDVKTTPVLSQIQAEQMKLNLEEANEQLKVVKAEMPFAEVSDKASRRSSEIDVLQSKMELQRADKNVRTMELKAPIDGMAVLQTIFRGTEMAQIREGDQLFPGQMFMQIVDPSSMVVNATVNQADVELIRLGARARLHIDAYPGLELPAHIIRIGAMTKPGGAREKFLREVPVVLKIDKLDSRVLPDLSVSADVVIEAADNLTVAPLESVFRDPGSGESYVYVKTGERFERRPVKIGLRNNVAAGVVEGLRAGEVIAVEEPKTMPPGGETNSKS